MVNDNDEDVDSENVSDHINKIFTTIGLNLALKKRKNGSIMAWKHWI